MKAMPRQDSIELVEGESPNLRDVACIARAEAKSRRIAAELRRVGVPAELIADSIQQAFVVLIRAIGQRRLKSAASLFAFVATAARHIGRAEARKRRAQLFLMGSAGHVERLPDASPTPDQLELARGRKRELLRLLPCLPARDALAVRLCVFEGRDRDVVQDQLGLTRQQLERALSRAVHRLRELVRERAPAPAPSAPKEGWRCRATELPDLRRRLARSSTRIEVLEPGVGSLGGDEAGGLVR